MVEHIDADAGVARIAARLGYLFEHRHPEGRGPYTIAEVVAGTGISESSIKQLRRGAKANPTINTLTAISSFFDAPPTIWVVPDDEVETVLARRDLTTAMRDSGVQSIALRSQGLNARNMARITDMIDMARESQGLPPIPPA
ncbi:MULTISPECIES: helix-turn-helix transcriptional regulator [unclassified Kitasatospora]|uniref:helix-turn-helix domain-containing protein n=1 Tax=unclassified Kitasatospora TaxID=2633591 RepID=UPI0033D5ABE8